MPNDLPLHLLLPLAASLVFVFGLMLIKKANSFHINPWTVTFCANMIAALLFQSYLIFGSDTPESANSLISADDPASLLMWAWQPGLIGVTFILGQVFTFSAISRGDVSVATPVFSVKVLLVAVLLTVVAGEKLSPIIWAAAALATAGIALVQFVGKSEHQRIGFTVLFALSAATSFSTHDVLVQRWSPDWPGSRFLPIFFVIVAVLSLGLLPLIQNPLRMKRPAQLVLLAGACCIAVQAMCIISSLSLFGDAARVNIVYALRGLWGVLLAFLLAKQFGSHEANVTRKVMIMRIIGATLLTLAVILAIVGGNYQVN